MHSVKELLVPADHVDAALSEAETLDSLNITKVCRQLSYSIVNIFRNINKSFVHFLLKFTFFFSSMIAIFIFKEVLQN